MFRVVSLEDYLHTHSMDSRIELQLEKTVVVLGPSVTTCLLNDTSELPPLTFESIRSTLFGDASSGSETDQLASRLQKTFPLAEAKETTAGNSPATVVEQLLDLQRSGALLAYLYPDTVVDRALGLASFSAVDVKKWVDHAQGIMHLYGVHTDVDSVQCMQDEKPIVTDSLLDVVKDKLCVCLGFDGDAEVQRDLHCFASQVPCDREAKQPRILLPCEKVFDTVRSLPVPITGNCCEALCPVGDTSKAIGLCGVILCCVMTIEREKKVKSIGLPRGALVVIVTARLKLFVVIWLANPTATF